MVRKIQRINPVGLYDPSPNGYTHVAIAPPGATIIYVAGQGGEDEKGNLVGDFAAQLTQAFANLRVALTAAGAHPEHVVKLTTLVVDHNESKLQQLTAVVQAMWGEPAPTQTLIPVPRLALDGMLFEVDAVAVIANS
ncbi:RidA family protein [Scytonema sp. PCC 10023]|uniref:RidA family protein n=1 Tax=Scytonema sp. PCC 10023 TaxID=1680591 RepID=UPI0039C6B6E3